MASVDLELADELGVSHSFARKVGNDILHKLKERRENPPEPSEDELRYRKLIDDVLEDAGGWENWGEIAHSYPDDWQLSKPGFFVQYLAALDPQRLQWIGHALMVLAESLARLPEERIHDIGLSLWDVGGEWNFPGQLRDGAEPRITHSFQMWVGKGLDYARK